MKIHRRHIARAAGLAIAVAALGSPAFAAFGGEVDALPSGLVLTSTNAVEGNELLVYHHRGDGSLELAHRVATGGEGSGAGLGSQGAVKLSGDGRFVFVVNALSNTVSTFAADGGKPAVASVVASGGLHPISITELNGIVYVLNDQGEGNIAGFQNVGGRLRPIPGSVKPLSASTGTMPAQIGFSADGNALVVSEKGTSRLTTYRMKTSARAGNPFATASSGIEPFGFAFDRRNHLLVTEAFEGAEGASAVSSYRFAPTKPALPLLVSASVGTTQTAACWISITPDGRWAYASNTGSSDVSRYRIAKNGAIALQEAVAATTGAGSSPADSAVSSDGGHLYVRSGGTASISSFAIGENGALTADFTATGLPATAVGLAAN